LIKKCREDRRRTSGTGREVIVEILGKKTTAIYRQLLWKKISGSNEFVSKKDKNCEKRKKKRNKEKRKTKLATTMLVSNREAKAILLLVMLL